MFYMGCVFIRVQLVARIQCVFTRWSVSSVQTRLMSPRRVYSIWGKSGQDKSGAVWGTPAGHQPDTNRIPTGDTDKGRVRREKRSERVPFFIYFYYILCILDPICKVFSPTGSGSISPIPKKQVSSISPGSITDISISVHSRVHCTLL